MTTKTGKYAMDKVLTAALNERLEKAQLALEPCAEGIRLIAVDPETGEALLWSLLEVRQGQRALLPLSAKGLFVVFDA